MQCKYCQAELESNSSVCPACGKDNLKDDLKGLKIVALSMVCLVMLVLLVGLVSYGTTGSFIPDWFKGPTEEEKFEAALENVVAEFGEHKLTNRQLQLYYWMCAYSYGDDTVDYTKDLAQQVYDEESGQTWEAYFLEKALEAWTESCIMVDKAGEAGFEMPEDYASQFETMEDDLTTMAIYYYGLSSADELIEQQFGPGCNFEVYESYAWNYYLGNLYWSELLGGLEVTDQDIEDYFNENQESLANDYDISITKDFGNLVDIRNILILVEGTEVEDEEGNKTTVITEEDWAECLAEAERILAEWKAGEMTAEKFGELASEYSKDSGSSTNAGQYTDLYAGCLSEVDVRHILIIPENGTLNDAGTGYDYAEEDWDAALAEVEAILEEWKAGEMTEESFEALAIAYSEDLDSSGNVNYNGLYEDVYLGQMVEAFEQWCFDTSRQSGDYGIVQSEYGYHIMYFVHADSEADVWAFDTARVAGDTAIVRTDEGYQILYLENSEAAWIRYSRYGAQATLASEMLDTLVAEAEVTVHDKKIVLGDITW